MIPNGHLDNYDFSQLDEGVQTEYCVENTQEALDKLIANRQRGIPSIESVDLSDAQIDALVAFLHTLTDPCTQDAACLSPWLPSTSDLENQALQLIEVAE